METERAIVQQEFDRISKLAYDYWSKVGENGPLPSFEEEYLNNHSRIANAIYFNTTVSEAYTNGKKAGIVVYFNAHFNENTNDKDNELFESLSYLWQNSTENSEQEVSEEANKHM